ncbi:hypothetical protein NGM10_16200 (plasmid) [Halorussus salilacus]|uniref:hypothetical protein n=1 Tax=Halorussus salilacus TaxID=2953750 RepID=UPI00209E15CA|nr:hypothetical protein [Halorussus salilacus]USZ69944.1 hypothetical protein NGM10_16200 [Halorussus salilacus]
MHEKTERHTRAIHDESVATMGRRRFMDTLLGLGFGALSAAFLTAEDVRAASDDEVPVVYGLVREGEELQPRRKSVPADWYDDFRTAVAANRRLGAVETDDVASSAVEPGEYGGANAAIRVEVTSEDARGEVPEEFEQVPVEVEKVARVESGEATERGDDSTAPGSESEDSEPETVEGGIPGSVTIGSEDLYGTLAPAMRDPEDGSLYFATANHIYDGSDNGGQPLYLLDGGKTRIGTVETGYPESDLVCATPESEFEPLHEIRNGSPGRVLGQFTRVGLSDLKAEGESLEKIGVKTGHTTGKIQAVDGFTCAYGAVCKRGQLKWGSESDFTDGDSGSVNFHADPENPDAGVLVGGLNNARTWWPGENYIWGTGAYHITEKHGFTF